MSEPLEEIQDAILDRLHAGEVPDRDAILAAHPDHRESLTRFLDLLQELESSPPPVDPRDLASLGEFKILRELGRGGMGIVYEAEQASLKRRVALKVLPPALGRDPRVVVRFRREAEAAGRLRHPNIVPVFSVGETGGTPFFAMELVEGRSLADAIRERSAGKDAGLPAAGEPWRRWVVETVARVADALHYAHGQGILHRDVKPANILLENSGVPRLTDFGLAVDLAAPGLTATGETFGTPLYMSPEQALRRETPLDPRTDVYSLGVSLYEALTLRTPYEGNSTPEILTALHQGKIVAPRTADPSMPEPLERIVLQALRKAPADRYETAGVFAADLRNWLASRPVEAVPPPPPPTAPKPEEEETEGYERHLDNAVWYGGIVLGMLVAAVAIFDIPMPWSKKSSNEGTESAAHSSGFTPAELLLLAEGKLPEGERRLAAWLRPRVRMRNVIARSSLGKYQCRVERGTIWDEGSDPYRVRIFGRFETSVDRGPWKEIPGATSVTLSSGVKGNTSVNPSLQDVLGDALKNGSVNLRHRARLRIVPWDVPAIGAKKDEAREVEVAFARPGGTTCTWEDERTLVVYDDYPDGYPESIARQDVDGAMLASLTPANWTGLDGSAGGEFGFTLQGLPEPGPLAAAFDVHWLHPKTGAVLGTTNLDREARDPAEVQDPNMTWGLGLLFAAPETPNPAREELAGKIRAGLVRSVRLRLRSSRSHALEKTTYERIWGRSLELLVPAESADPKSKAEVRFVEPEPEVSVSVSMDGDEPERFTRSALQRLAAGKPRRGDPTIVHWTDVRAAVPSIYSLKEGGGPRYQYPCYVRLRPAKSAESGEPGEDVLVLALWERALGSGPWTELGFTATTLSEGGGELEASMDEIREAYKAGAGASIRHRAKIRLLPRPEGWKALRENLSEAWKLPAADSCTHTQANALEIVETYPETYPAAVRGKTEDEEAGMVRAVTPRALEFGGKSSNADSVFLHGVLLESPGGGFAPAAFDVDLYFEGDGVPVATGQATISLPEPGKPPHPVSQQITFSKPFTPENENALEAARKRLSSGEVKSVRLVFRPSRRVAIQATDWERYWGGTVDVTVPVKAR